MESHANARENDQLIRAVLAGNERAFDELVGLHKRFVFNLCYRLLGDYDDADDCAQEVFIKVFKSLDGFRFESDFKTWLYRIAVNTCKNRFRSLEYRVGQKKVRLDMHDEDDEKKVELGDPKQSPAADFKRKEIGRLIQSAVSKLPADQRLVVVLRDMEGRSYEEIIEITGLKLGTLKSKLSRARLRLRASLKGAI
jgi:RNA polymerase sigma-70 factor (ECF subfamily)